jgi:hypothetical protein
VILTIVVPIVSLVILVFAAGRIVAAVRFRREVEELFSQSGSLSDMTFSSDQLAGLPEPVQRYFSLVLEEGTSYISYVRLTHDGQFRPDLNRGWVPIRGEQYYTTERPGFVWRGKTLLFTARDMYLSGRGRIVVTLFSLIKIVDGRGETYDQSELLRWLGESVWFPTNMLPRENLTWSPVDSRTAKLTFEHDGSSLVYTVRFNDQGEITRLETKRYMGEDRLETWIGTPSDYREMSGVLIPMTIEASWRLRGGDESYARFTIQKIEYDVPKKY